MLDIVQSIYKVKWYLLLKLIFKELKRKKKIQKCNSKVLRIYIFTENTSDVVVTVIEPGFVGLKGAKTNQARCNGTSEQ